MKRLSWAQLPELRCACGYALKFCPELLDICLLFQQFDLLFLQVGSRLIQQFLLGSDLGLGTAIARGTECQLARRSPEFAAVPSCIDEGYQGEYGADDVGKEFDCRIVEQAD